VLMLPPFLLQGRVRKTGPYRQLVPRSSRARRRCAAAHLPLITSRRSRCRHHPETGVSGCSKSLSDRIAGMKVQFGRLNTPRPCSMHSPNRVSMSSSGKRVFPARQHAHTAAPAAFGHRQRQSGWLYSTSSIANWQGRDADAKQAASGCRCATTAGKSIYGEIPAP